VAKCLTCNISATMRDRGVVSMDHLHETIWRESWSRDRRRHVIPKGQGRDPKIF